MPTRSFSLSQTMGTGTAIVMLPTIFAATLSAVSLASEPEAIDVPTSLHSGLLWGIDTTHSPFLSSLSGTRVDPLQKLRAAIDRLRDLPENWDGYGAEQVSTRSIEYALLFIQSYRDHADFFEVYPDADGTVMIENRSGNNRVYINFSSTGDIAYVLRTQGGVQRGRGLDVIAMKKLLDAIYF